MILSPQKINELLGIIDNFHLIFIARNIGLNVLSDSEKKILNSIGVNLKDWTDKEGKISEAFKFGLIVDAIGDKRAKSMNYDEFKKFIQSGNFIPLTESERLALQHLEYHAYSDIKGLGNRISNDFRTILIEGDKEQREMYERIIAEESYEATLKRESVKSLASKLGHKTQDWSRDFDRIADYVMHTAFDNGIAQGILRDHGADSLVYKSVYENACENCIRIYLTGGIGSKPRLFKLSTLLANGTNIGKKVADWKACIAATHPYCRCQLHHFEPNSVWDEKTKDYTGVKRETYGVKRKSKAKILITKS